MKTPPERGIFCNRTLNFRSIKAIGYDMDYTLVQYHAEEWERRAYDYLKQKFLGFGWNVGHLEFDPRLTSRGLIVDLQLGNLIKANRFGFVKRACHGTRLLDFEIQRKEYSRIIVDLAEPRWVFLNTLFSISEGCMYAQLVELLDAKKLPETMGYRDLYHKVRGTLDALHREGDLKKEIIQNPDRYVALDAETPLTLLDQKNAGKKLLLITNSEWGYTVPMMTYTFDRFLPPGTAWQDLFDLVIIGARKPEFFTSNSPFYEVATQDGLLRPDVYEMRTGCVYQGGSARQLEKYLGLSGDEILYVGDHMFGDVHVTKNVLRWRTALVLSELEDELKAVVTFKEQEAELIRLMEEKERIEADVCQLRLEQQRRRSGYGPRSEINDESLQQELIERRLALEKLDLSIAPLAKAEAELSNSMWGLLMRAGNDKSHLARQMERYADIYTSRVSNLLYSTPFMYMRSRRGNLPHDTLRNSHL